MTSAANILVISDLHLGEHLGPDREDSLALDKELVSFLDHYRVHRSGSLPWHLVINGDMVDFLGVLLMPAEVGVIRGLPEDDHHYGLGDGPMASAIKMRKVMAHHEGVFQALARFVASGHSLSMVLGNHDADFHWIQVQEVFREGLADLALASLQSGQMAQENVNPPTRDELLASVAFHPWFFHEAGVVWIEHGHQYDPYCSFDDVLAPATDGLEIDPTIGGVVLRYLTNRFEPDVAKYWGGGFLAYIRGWLAQGTDRMASILLGYRDMVIRLVEHWRMLRPDRIAARRARHRRRLKQLAGRFRISEDKLLRLSKLRKRPFTSHLVPLLSAVQLDRLLLLLFGPLVLLLPLLFSPWGWVVTIPLILMVLGIWVVIAARRRAPVDPRPAMRKVARTIRDVVSVPIVVFGHSHQAEAQQDGEGWTFNTGTWVPEPDRHRAFTHVLIERAAQGTMVARLCQWREGASQAFGLPGLQNIGAKVKFRAPQDG